MRRALLSFVAVFCAGWPLLAQAPVAVPTRTEQVAMRDGTLLATDLYLPAGEGRWPVVVWRTPYNKAAGMGAVAAGAARAGVAGVVQDVRGRFASKGRNYPFIADGWGEQQDGYDTLKWIAAQPWCNGKIGTSGGSALGLTQVMSAPSQPPGLVCQWIAVAAGDFYHRIARPGGAMSKSLMEVWLTLNRFDSAALEDMKAHDTYDDYWKTQDADAVAERVTVPAVFQGGWYDVFQQGLLDAFKARQERGGAGAKGQQKLIIGPWPHGGGAVRPVGELTYPENARQAPAGTPTEPSWFAHWLLGQPNGVERAAAVTYYQMGAVGEPDAPGNVWKTADAWPVPSTATPLYLQPDGGLSLTAPPAAGAARSFDFDPANPVPTKGGCNLTLPAGPYDQRSVENRPDVLLFTSAPLEQPLAVTGPLNAVVWVASDQQFADLTVKLTDVYPDGRSMWVADGIRRLRFRHGYERPEVLEPGKSYEVTVDLWSTSLVVNRGHRLRVAVSSSNSPRFDVTNVKSRQTIFLDAAKPSRVVLPVVQG